MTNKINQNEQITRMKKLMTYGMQNESKNAPYSSVEYQKLGADGKVYGIVREGTRYYIKTAPQKANLVKEDFNYIGGFRNRMDNAYSNYALAQKQFDLKMMSLKEAANNKDISVSSWDLGKKENLVIEASDKMKKEILRERQIMSNAKVIAEKKGAICCDEPELAKDNIKKDKPKQGNAKKAVKGEKAKLPKEMGECAVTEQEVLGWNRKAPDMMDKSHGTQIGSSAPFDVKDKAASEEEMENGTVEEGKSMHDCDCQNCPKPGVNKVGSSKPFDKKKGKSLKEGADGIDDDEADIDNDEADIDSDVQDIDNDEADIDNAEADIDNDEADIDDAENDIDSDVDDIDSDIDDIDTDDDDVYEDDLVDRVDAMEELLNQIADKLGVDTPPVDDSEYEDDDDLFDDDDDTDDEDEYELSMDDDNDGYDDETEPYDNEGDDELGYEDDDDTMRQESRRYRGSRIYETKAFRKAMRNRRMNEALHLDDFGKHPAYQKKVMNLPPKDMQEFPDYYDMNDDSVRSDAPYGTQIGSSAPFDVDVDTVDGAIDEAFRRLKKKSR